MNPDIFDSLSNLCAVVDVFPHLLHISLSPSPLHPSTPTAATAAAAAAAAKSLQSCPTLCNLTAGSPPGSVIPRILQARTLEWFPLPLVSFNVGTWGLRDSR